MVTIRYYAFQRDCQALLCDGYRKLIRINVKQCVNSYKYKPSSHELNPREFKRSHTRSKLDILERMSQKRPKGRERRQFHSMTEMQEFFREEGRRGGKIGGKRSAKRMSKAARIARARKAGRASGKARRAKALKRRRETG
jgi:hypothetical protein